MICNLASARHTHRRVTSAAAHLAFQQLGDHVCGLKSDAMSYKMIFRNIWRVWLLMAANGRVEIAVLGEGTE
jgi:hypothetical protein